MSDWIQWAEALILIVCIAGFVAGWRKAKKEVKR